MPQASLIIPIYRRPDQLQRLWESLLAHTAPALVAEVFLINDSPDDPSIESLCQKIQTNTADFPCFYLKNPQNWGFPRTCNRGFEAKQAQTPAVILNTDIILQEDWLEKLLHCYTSAQKQFSRIASITPLTNNGTLAIVPRRFQVYDTYEGLNSPRSMNRLAALWYGTHDVNFQIPVGVGFCFLMTSEALAALGGFDPIFSPGYGEEVDWCLRAFRQGFVSLLDPATYIYHQGGESFGPAKLQLMQEHEQWVVARHPHYHQRLRDYIQADSPFYLQQLFQLYWAVGKALRWRKLVVHLTTLNPFEAVGGMEHCLLETCRVDEEKQAWGSLIIARPHKTETSHYAVWTESGTCLLRGTAFQLQTFFRTLSEAFEVTYPALWLQHTLRWEQEEIHSLIDFFQQRGSLVRALLHDYYAVSEYYNLLCPHRQESLFLPSTVWKLCPECLNTPREQQHRLNHLKLLEKCKEILMPSLTSRRILAQVPEFESLIPRFRVQPHYSVVPAHEALPLPTPQPSVHKRFKWAFLGYDRQAKGSGLFFELAQTQKTRAEFIFIGNSETLIRDPFLRQIPYDFHSQNPVALLQSEAPDAVMLLSLWPETFGLTLFECIQARMPVLTLATAGHIAAEVEAWGIGAVFADFQALKGWLTQDIRAIRADLAVWRERLHQLQIMSHLGTPVADLPLNPLSPLGQPN